MKSPVPIRVLCIDDHPMILEGVRSMLNAEPGMLFAAGAMNGDDGLSQFRHHLPDIALVDLRMKGMSGIATIAAIKREFPNARIIAMTTYKGDDDIHKALTAGADGYILKDLMHKDLMFAIQRVCDGHRWIAPEAAAQLAENTPRIELTARELEVLQLVAEGKRNKQISQVLGVTEDTIKFHLKSILGKLCVDDRTHAVTIAVKRGIIHLD